MANVLFINPSKWRRGITPIWITSHSAPLKSKEHQVKLFDATFYKKWSIDEITFNTSNEQYKPSAYSQFIKLNEKDIISDLQQCIDEYKPDIIFWSFNFEIYYQGQKKLISVIGVLYMNTFKTC